MKHCSAPAEVTYSHFYDFNYPLEWNRSIITVAGYFYQPDAAGAVFSSIFTPVRSTGNMKRLFDPSDPPACNMNNAANVGVTAANFYAAAVQYASWRP